MQIQPTEEQLKLIKQIFDYVIWPFAGWFAKTAYSRLKTSINEVITDNANRVRDEIVVIVQKMFDTHEETAFGRLTKLEELFSTWQQKNNPRN